VNRLRPWQLAAGDVVAVGLFAPVGLLSHHEGITPAGLARNLLPVAGGFLVAGLLLGTWRRPERWRLAAAWLVGVASGVLVRAAILGHGYGRTTFTFMAVTLVVTGLLLLAWRGVVTLAARRSRRVEPVPSGDGPVGRPRV
jgi:peptidoglycan/LPS O-acetylase OafA/YrhL